tara:strand:- start:419 stop:643 length:225 start_codon:yes stop_codon:yes gene_type:complete
VLALLGLEKLPRVVVVAQGMVLLPVMEHLEVVVVTAVLLAQVQPHPQQMAQVSEATMVEVVVAQGITLPVVARD